MKKSLFFASVVLITGTSIGSHSLNSLALPTTAGTTYDRAQHRDSMDDSHGEGHHDSMGDSHEEGHHDSMGDSHGGHHHGTMEIPEGQPIPSVNLMVSEDSIKGWNLEVQFDNFTLTPENVNMANRPGEGHAHIYINGEKMTRLYGNWYYLEELPPGKHEISISLNTNGHETLTHNGEPIQATAIVEVPDN